MKVLCIKNPGGVLTPASDEEAEKLIKFKTGEHYEVDIKLSRNPAFHRKVMAFFKFCFEHWDAETTHEHLSSKEQFERFRKDLTILAGFYTKTVRLNGEIRLEAESLAFASMKQERFEECYNALINASMRTIFKSSDQNTYNQLVSFF